MQPEPLLRLNTHSMAIDTQTKRRSVLAAGLISLVVLPLADTTIAITDSMHVCGYYSGIAPQAGLQTTALHILHTGVLEPNHVVDSGDNVLIGNQIEAQGGGFFGGVTNYTQISATGVLTMAGTARVKKEIQVTAEDFRKGASSPTAAIIGNYAVLQFAGVATTQSVNTTFHLPDDMDLSEDLTVHVHWAPSNANAGNVKWQITWDATASENGELISDAGATITVIDATQTTQDELLETADMTIPAASLAAEDTIGITLFRDPTDGDDTYGSAASFVLVEFGYIANKLGDPL